MSRSCQLLLSGWWYTASAADRIVVLTRRPGRIKLIHEVKLPRPRDVIKLRETDDYAREYSQIWHVLGEEFAEHVR